MISLRKFKKLCAGDAEARKTALQHLLDAGLLEERAMPDGSGVVYGFTDTADSAYVRAFFEGCAEAANLQNLIGQVGELLNGQHPGAVMYTLGYLLVYTIETTEDDAEFKEYLHQVGRWTDYLISKRFGSGGTA
jgi:hypothetical protein